MAAIGRIFFAAALLAVASLPAAANPVAEATALIAQGRFIEAIELLDPAANSRDRPAHNTVFLYGMAAIGAAERPGLPEEERDALLDRAIAAFHAVLVRDPGLSRVRLELARAFFLKGEDELATRHFEHVLAGEIPPPVAANIRRFLHIIRARKRWTSHLGFALAPDSNLNGASEDRTILLDTPFGRLPFTLNRKPRSGVGLSIWGGGEYQYPLAPDLRLRAGADARLHEYKGGDFDRYTVSAHIGPRKLLDARTEASLLATADRQWQAGTPVQDRFGVRLEGEYRLTPRAGLFARASVARRDCRDCDHLDGTEGSVALGAGWIAMPTLRLNAQAGWGWSRANAEHWRNGGPQIGLGATVALPAGFTVGVSASMQRTEYRGDGSAHFTLDRKPREDETTSYSLSIHNRAFTVLGFSPRLSLVREERETNAQTLDYERNRIELSFVRQF